MDMSFSNITVGGHTDPRRTIVDIVFPEGFAFPFPVVQMKTVRLSEEAITGGLVVGNHYHPVASRRQELFVAVGPKEQPLFKFRYREEVGGEVKERVLSAGDTCLVVPPCTHSFIGLVHGAELWVLSNKSYDDADTVSDKLF
jgi:dTDP-4-dehydrorhamnose 3,5-epimerase-like enzyme